MESLSMQKIGVSTAHTISADKAIPAMLITRQRKVETMVNHTPLRLVAIEESPPAEHDERSDAITEHDLVAIEESPTAEDNVSANPITIMTEHDAITRRVQDAANVAARESPPDTSKRFSRWRALLPAATVVVVSVSVAVVVALVATGRRTPTPGPTSASGTPVRGAGSPSQQASTPPVAAMPSQIGAVRDTIRIEITAEPKAVELSLDGNVLGGHRLNLEVPKDRGIHVVSASAAGYIPFNQQVSFSSDVVLNISLHRAQLPPVHQVARRRLSQHESIPKNSIRPATSQPDPGIEPGMNLDGPSMRHNAKPIDERNPYKP
jgi:hypothetical protein